MVTMDDAKAVVLLSGGLDSATVGGMARADRWSCFGLTVAYGQRHGIEIGCAGRVAAALNFSEHKTIELDLRGIGGSALTDDMAVPKDGVEPSGIPLTYVPARNTILLALALAWAEVLGAYDIFIGANAVDYSGYPDCRPDFVAAFENLANLATQAAVAGKGRFTIHAPLIAMTKCQIIRKGLELGIDYSLTHSCYDPDDQGRACGQCDACRLRKKGFAEAGVPDPIDYAT